MKDSYIVSKTLRGRFTESRLMRPIILLQFFAHYVDENI